MAAESVIFEGRVEDLPLLSELPSKGPDRVSLTNLHSVNT